MKCKDIQYYGITGKRVEFSLMDCYASSHVLERIKELRERHNQFFEDGILDIEQTDWSEILRFMSDSLDILRSLSNFLNKIALKPSEDASIFAAEESEEKES